MSTDDLKRIVDKIILFLTNQHAEHAAAFDSVKI